MRTTAENMMQAFGIKKNLCIATELHWKKPKKKIQFEFTDIVNRQNSNGSEKEIEKAILRDMVNCIRSVM